MGRCRIGDRCGEDLPQIKRNPIAETLSYAMMLRYSFDLGKEADLVETAIENVLKAGYRTGDLVVGKTEGTRKVGTQEMGDAIVKELDRLV